LIEQSRTKRADDSKQKHSGCYAGRFDVEALRFPLQRAKAHRKAWKKQDTSKYTANDRPFDELRFALVESDAIKVNFDDS